MIFEPKECFALLNGVNMASGSNMRKIEGIPGKNCGKIERTFLHKKTQEKLAVICV